MKNNLVHKKNHKISLFDKEVIMKYIELCRKEDLNDKKLQK